jgi:hypothetical protein
MKAINKVKISIKAVLVIAVALAFVIPTSAVVTNIKTNTNNTAQIILQPALHKVLPKQNPMPFGTNVLISSDNPSLDDETPKVTVNGTGCIVVTYEKKIDDFTRTIPIAYSVDNGSTWTTQFELNSIEWTSGSGYLNTPDIKYDSAAQIFVWSAIDPLADIYNEHVSQIPYDIADATSMSIMGISGTSSTEYTEGACTYVGPWIIDLAVSSISGITKCLGLGYFTYDAANDTYIQPSDVNSGWAAGFYYDGGSILKTSEVSHPEMATGNRLYMCMESHSGIYTNISFKSTVTDLNPSSPTFLFTSGGGPGGMDKFADCEVWPLQQKYVAINATDPDIGARGDQVVIVYSQGGDVKCTASTDLQNWTVSTVATGAGYPAVYVTNDKVFCAYVKSGNLYLVNSTDSGVTWGTSQQMNDQDGTVAAQSGSVDLGAMGAVWTDTRNGAKDIYYQYIKLEIPPAMPIMNVDKISGGLGVSAIITNTGTVDATNVNVTFKFSGGLVFPKQKTVSVGTIAKGGQATAKAMAFGFGKPTITITATCAEGPTATKTASGLVLLFLVLGVK